MWHVAMCGRSSNTRAVVEAYLAVFVAQQLFLAKMRGQITRSRCNLSQLLMGTV